MTREDIKQRIVVGKSTKDSVTDEFGEPTARIAGNNGKDEWKYIYKEREFTPADFLPFVEKPKATGKQLNVKFNTRGVVTEFSVEDIVEQDDAYWGK